ncbi:MAG TPA: anti-sigma factor [Mesorhizobium sp.]|jgi:anti-sigma-K factor RskA|uniref:anti-sigma factor n=1 Tax=Mesorhizobium sp. TaxID=1871066 RepID=UPI002DDDA83C|nr:anti-sigma factor [Mesorhizobium sp.]HEV2504886.1 anti-sigma factor [Mesorhizobium sp.]
MTESDHTGPERDDDALAAEYVLGVLSADERQTAAQRVEHDPAFARLVYAWEGRLSPLAAGYAEVAAPASVKAAIDRRLFSNSVEQQDRDSLWSSLAFWRGLAAAAIAALVLAISVPYLGAPSAPPQAELVASLAGEGSDVRYVAVYDGVRNEVRLSRLSGQLAADKDFELWLIEGTNAPVSVGVVPTGATAQLSPSAEVREKLGQGAVLAISLEPKGGSPTGQPTGPVVAAGDLKDI